MKNKEVYIVIVVIVVALILVLALGKEDNKSNVKSQEDPQSILERAQSESSSVKENEKKELAQINVTEYLDYYSGEEPKLILIARPTCHYCQIAEPIIENIAYMYDLEIYYLNTDNFTEDDEQKLESSDELFQNGFGTPLLLNVGNNSIIGTVDGLTDSQHYIDFFKENGYIK